MVEPSFIDYSALSTLSDKSHLPVAAFTSQQGYEQGRELAQKNGQFIADYFFGEHQ